MAKYIDQIDDAQWLSTDHSVTPHVTSLGEPCDCIEEAEFVAMHKCFGDDTIDHNLQLCPHFECDDTSCRRCAVLTASTRL